ncbi:MAG: ribosome silencing factor [Syntrophales bacterium]
MVKEDINTQKRVILCINALLEKKARDVIILNVKGLSNFTDYFVICSGTSDRQVRALASSIQENLKKSGIVPLGVEGGNSGVWVLMDYDDLIVHIFYEPVREFYDLERLWSDATQMKIGEDVTKLTSLNEGM